MMWYVLAVAILPIAILLFNFLRASLKYASFVPKIKHIPRSKTFFGIFPHLGVNKGDVEATVQQCILGDDNIPNPIVCIGPGFDGTPLIQLNGMKEVIPLILIRSGA